MRIFKCERAPKYPKMGFGMKNKIYRAGLLPYCTNDSGDIEFLFMKPADPQYGGDQFQIAKGKIEEGESDKEAAVREASEELGLLTDNIVKVFKLGVFLGRTTLFVARIRDRGRFNTPHFETGETKWMTAIEFCKMGRSIHIPIVIEADDFIRSLTLGDAV